MTPKVGASMKIYRGVRIGPLGCKVTVDGEPLDPRLELRRHSPTGFEWGYGGSGPAQLALALLAEEFGSAPEASLYQAFKFRVVAKLPDEEWTMTSVDIRRAVQDLLATTESLP